MIYPEVRIRQMISLPPPHIFSLILVTNSLFPILCFYWFLSKRYQPNTSKVSGVVTWPATTFANLPSFVLNTNITLQLPVLLLPPVCLNWLFAHFKAFKTTTVYVFPASPKCYKCLCFWAIYILKERKNTNLFFFCTLISWKVIWLFWSISRIFPSWKEVQGGSDKSGIFSSYF